MHNTEWIVLLNIYEILENSAPALMFHQLQLNTSVQMDRAQMATSPAEFASALDHMLLRSKKDAEFALKLGLWYSLGWRVPHGSSDLLVDTRPPCKLSPGDMAGTWHWRSHGCGPRPAGRRAEDIWWDFVAPLLDRKLGRGGCHQQHRLLGME